MSWQMMIKLKGEGGWGLVAVDERSGKDKGGKNEDSEKL